MKSDRSSSGSLKRKIPAGLGTAHRSPKPSRYKWFHASRRTFATQALNAGTDIFPVSKLLEYAKLRTTEAYIRELITLKQDAVNRLPPISLN
jgi:hypothetical protein